MTGPRCPDLLLGLLKKVWENPPVGWSRPRVRQDDSEGWDLLGLTVNMNIGTLEPRNMSRIWDTLRRQCKPLLSESTADWLLRCVAFRPVSNLHNLWDTIRLFTRDQSHRRIDCVVLWSCGGWSQPADLPPPLVGGVGWRISSFLWHHEGLCWGAVAHKRQPKTSPWTVSNSALKRILSRPGITTPRPEALKTISNRIEFDRTRCGPQCRGSKGHVCQLVEAGHLPHGLSPLIDLLRI
jgi:hypothetical protein